MSTLTDERVPDVDSVLRELSELATEVSRKRGYDNRFAKAARDARNTIRFLMRMMNQAFDTASDSMDLADAVTTRLEKIDPESDLRRVAAILEARGTRRKQEHRGNG